MGSVEEQRKHQGYFVRLGSLSTRLRHLAYEHSLGKLRQKKHHAQDTLAQLQETLELVRALSSPSLPCDAGQHAWTECQPSTCSCASLKVEAEACMCRAGAEERPGAGGTRWGSRLSLERLGGALWRRGSRSWNLQVGKVGRGLPRFCW